MYFWGANSWSDPKGKFLHLPRSDGTKCTGETPSPVLTLQRKRISQACLGATQRDFTFILADQCRQRARGCTDGGRSRCC